MGRGFNKAARSPWPMSTTKGPSAQEAICPGIFSMLQRGGVTYEIVEMHAGIQVAAARTITSLSPLQQNFQELLVAATGTQSS